MVFAVLYARLGTKKIEHDRGMCLDLLCQGLSDTIVVLDRSTRFYLTILHHDAYNQPKPRQGDPYKKKMGQVSITMLF